MTTEEWDEVLKDKIATAEDFLLDYEQEYFEGAVYGDSAYKTEEVVKAMKDFASMHVMAALKEASEKAMIIEEVASEYGDSEEDVSYSIYSGGRIRDENWVEVNKESIINAYSLDNII